MPAQVTEHGPTPKNSKKKKKEELLEFLLIELVKFEINYFMELDWGGRVHYNSEILSDFPLLPLNIYSSYLFFFLFNLICFDLVSWLNGILNLGVVQGDTLAHTSLSSV